MYSSVVHKDEWPETTGIEISKFVEISSHIILPSVHLCKCFFQVGVWLFLPSWISSLVPKTKDSISITPQRTFSVYSYPHLGAGTASTARWCKASSSPWLAELWRDMGERAGNGAKRSFRNGVQAVKLCPAPFFHSWGFGCVSLKLSSMVTLAARDLLTVLQTFPHSGRLDTLFILLSSPESLHVWAKPAFVYNFSGNFHRGGKKKNPPSSSSVLFLSQHFPQVYLCSTKFSYKVLLYIQMGIAPFL